MQQLRPTLAYTEHRRRDDRLLCGAVYRGCDPTNPQSVSVPLRSS
jgi:hypothetical protein